MKRWMHTLAALMLLIGLVAPSTFVRAQDAPKAAEGDERKTESEPAEFDHSVQFENLGGLMFVKVKVNDKGPYDFLFDSGAQITVISARLATELDLELSEMPGGGMQGVGTAEAKAAVVEQFEFAGFARGKTGCGSLDMDHVSGGLGRHMMGIIGQNIMKQMKKLVVDFSTSTINFDLYAADEMPVDQTEQVIIQTAEGGGMPGIPGFPGMPGPGQPEKKPEKQPEKKPGEEEDDEFSLPAMKPWNYFLQDGTATEAKPANRNPREGTKLSYTTGELEIPFLGKLEVTPFWHVEAFINGKARRFMFDTGANGLLILSDGFIEEMKLDKSFVFTVKGVSEGSASAGIVDSFEMGSVKETDAAFMSNALFKVSDQVKEQLGPVGRMLKGLEKLDFDGIIGIDYAHRFKTMTVDTVEHTLSFEPYGDEEENGVAPYEGEDTLKEAVIRTWNGRACDPGLDCDSVPLADWEAKGLPTGGMVIEDLLPDFAGDKAGLKVGDIITHLVDPVEGEVPLRDGPELVIYACLQDPGSEMKLRYLRDGKPAEATLKLTKYNFDGTFPERFKDK